MIFFMVKQLKFIICFPQLNPIFPQIDGLTWDIALLLVAITPYPNSSADKLQTKSLYALTAPKSQEKV